MPVLPHLAAAALVAGSPSYALDLRLDRAATTLRGTERIAFVNRGAAPVEEVWLRTWAYGPGGCDAPGIEVAVARGGRAARRESGCTALLVRLGRRVEPGGRGVLTLRLRVRAPRQVDRFGRWRGVAYFGNALPLLAVGERPAGGWPPYSRIGEAFVSEVAAWRARIALPRGIRAATTGTTVRERPLVVRAPQARDFAVAAGRLRRTVRRAGGVRIAFWTARRGLRTRAALDAAADALRAFGTAWGPYPGRELDLVDAPLGMEYPELVLTAPRRQVVAHEAAHQWWWGLVGSDQAAHPWLDESLAQYASLRLAGGASAPCSGPSDGAAGRPMAYWERHAAAYGPVVYSGGACAWQALERAWGRAPLDAALRSYVAAHRFGLATPADLRAALAGAPAGALSAWQRAFGV